jgi:hypothetical protein
MADETGTADAAAEQSSEPAAEPADRGAPPSGLAGVLP